MPDKKTRGPYKQYIYPALVEWLARNNRTVQWLAYQCGYTHQNLGNFIRGKSRGSKHIFDAILHVTGMKYEEAFAK